MKIDDVVTGHEAEPSGEQGGVTRGRMCRKADLVGSRIFIEDGTCGRFIVGTGECRFFGLCGEEGISPVIQHKKER